MKTEKIFGQMSTEYAIATKKYDYDIDVIYDTRTTDLNWIKEEYKKYDPSNHIIVIRNVTPWCEMKIV